MSKLIYGAPLGALFLIQISFADVCSVPKAKFDRAFQALDRSCKVASDCMVSDRIWDQCGPKIYINLKNTTKILEELDLLRAQAHKACKFVMAPCPSIPALTPVCRLGMCAGEAKVQKIPTH